MSSQLLNPRRRACCIDGGRDGSGLLQLLGGVDRERLALNRKGADAGFDQAQLLKFLGVLQGGVVQGIPALEHVSAVAVEVHVAPVGGVLRPVEGIDVAHMGHGRAGEVEGTAIGCKQGFDHVGVVHLLGTEAVGGGEHFRGGRAAVEFSGHGVDRCGIDEGLIALHVDDQGAVGLKAAAAGQELIGHGGDALTARFTGRAGEDGVEAPGGCRGGEIRTVGAEQHRCGSRGQAAALEHTPQHRLAADVGQHLAGQASGFEAGRYGHDAGQGHQS